MSYCRIIRSSSIENLGEETYEYEYYRIIANISGDSGMIIKTFRSGEIFIEDGSEGEFEYVSRDKDNNGLDDNCLYVYSKKPLLPTKPMSLGVDKREFYQYGLEADIENQDHFPCFYPNKDNVFGNNVISINELYGDMISFYEKIFSIEAYKDNVGMFKVFYE